MHRVHHFDTTEAAYEASLNEWDVREGDVLVIEAERVVGLGSTDPIAITFVAGALKTIAAMTRDELLAELVHGAPEIGYAVDEALRHGWPVAPHYLGCAGPQRCLPSSQAAVTQRAGRAARRGRRFEGAILFGDLAADIHIRTCGDLDCAIGNRGRVTGLSGGRNS